MTGAVVTGRARAGVAISMLVLGVALLIVAVAGFVIVPEHAPHTSYVLPDGEECLGNCEGIHTGWSQTLHDAARIGTRAALIVSIVLVVLGVIRYAQRSRVA